MRPSGSHVSVASRRRRGALPPLPITVTLTATDPDGLSVSLDGNFLIGWENFLIGWEPACEQTIYPSKIGDVS